MILYAAVRNGRLQFSLLGGAAVEIEVGSDELEQLVEYFISKTLSGWKVLPVGGTELPGGWDGHIMCSSSIDWAKDYGWPEETADPFIASAIKMAMERVHEMGRRFGPFIRFAMARSGLVYSEPSWFDDEKVVSSW